jgi:hypothetical protein
MKKLIRKIWKAVQKAYSKIVDSTRQYVPIAIEVVEALKRVMDSDVDDVVAEIIKRVIPGKADDLLIEKIKTTVELWLPKILLELRMVQGVAQQQDVNTQLKAILAELKLSSDESKAIVYHGLATLILEKLSDGELSFSDSAAIAEYYYRSAIKGELPI